jgi:hypothetical protein
VAVSARTGPVDTATHTTQIAQVAHIDGFTLAGNSPAYHRSADRADVNDSRFSPARRFSVNFSSRIAPNALDSSYCRDYN